MTRVLVTGAAGFMGSHVVDKCLALGFDVVAVDNLSGGYSKNVNPNATFINASAGRSAEWLFRESGPFDYVYHLSAYAAEGLSHYIRCYNYETNLIESIELINQSILHKVKRFVFTSSIAVYGHGQKRSFRETDAPSPVDPYGISKYAVELDLMAAAKQFGMPYTIFRPHNVYGPRQNISDPFRNVIGIFIRQVLNGEPMTIFGDGNQTRQFTYISDISAPIASCVRSSKANQIYNAGTGVSRASVFDLARIVAEVFEVDCVIKYLPQRNEVEHATADHKKFNEVFKPRSTQLSSGVRLMKKWVDEVGMPEPTHFTGDIEVPINMPPSWQKYATKVSS